MARSDSPSFITSPTTSEREIIKKIEEISNFPSKGERSMVISGLRWIGLFRDEVDVEVRGGNLLDTLCGWLEKLMSYEDGERDMMMLQHKFMVEWKDKSTASFFLFFRNSCLMKDETLTSHSSFPYSDDRTLSRQPWRCTENRMNIALWRRRSTFHAVSQYSWCWME
jgi:hypothetical protein